MPFLLHLLPDTIYLFIHTSRRQRTEQQPILNNLASECHSHLGQMMLSVK